LPADPISSQNEGIEREDYIDFASKVKDKIDPDFIDVKEAIRGYK
jgi:hypothetical protein